MDSAFQEEHPRPHPYLHEPLLYITNLPPYVSDENLAVAFMQCSPFRPRINRDGSPGPYSGTIEFKFLEKAEKALAILQSRNIPDISVQVPLILSPYPPTTPPTPLPPPSAMPRLVKQLPLGYSDSQLYDLFRPYGALASARTPTQFGPDTGMVEFWNEEDAQMAEEALHCSEVEGQNVAVQLYQPRRASHAVREFNPAAPSFVPAPVNFSPFHPQYSPPPRVQPYSPVRSPVPIPSSPFIHGPGQQVQLAPPTGPGSNSHSGLIDPCNLFIKNLSPEIDSNSLFAHFHKFGQIVSARVMRNEHGDSRGFGFVSYHQPEYATEALRLMNGALLGTKQIVVRLHEPKQLRQEKLAHRFGHNGHPRRNSSGATSPTASEAGEFSAWNSPRSYTQNLGSPALSPLPVYAERQDRGRRGSGSYYTAAVNGTLQIPLQYNSLSALSPVVRKEVLTGELVRRVKTTEALNDKEVGALVDSMVSLSLSNVLQYLDDPTKLQEQIRNYKSKLPPAEAPEVASRDGSDPPSYHDSEDNPATASAPEHPSTPVSIAQSLSTPPRTSSPAGSVPPLSERDRIYAAILKLEPSRQTELADLIMSLPKRDRALCLFNTEILRSKIMEAKAVLDSDGDVGDARSTKSAPAPVPVTPQQRKVASSMSSPQTPDLSSTGTSAASLPSPPTPRDNNATNRGSVLASDIPTDTTTTIETYTIASLARLPATEIIKLANSNKLTGLPLPKADKLIVQTTDEFINGLLTKTVPQQKQALGEKLFRVVKSFEMKGSVAPKVTIALLDQEDLRALAHLMNSYPSVLKEKALALGISKGTSST